jgi:hypothetical protein
MAIAALWPAPSCQAHRVMGAKAMPPLWQHLWRLQKKHSSPSLHPWCETRGVWVTPANRALLRVPRWVP